MYVDISPLKITSITLKINFESTVKVRDVNKTALQSRKYAVFEYYNQLKCL